MKQRAYVLDNYKEVLAFLKTRFPLYHQSNFFFRDVQYGIMTMLERKDLKVGYTEAESIAREFVEKLEKEKIFLPIDRQTWVVHYPEFRKPVVKAAPAKPAGPAAAAPRPAAAPGARPAVPAGSAVPRPAGPAAPRPVAAPAASTSAQPAESGKPAAAGSSPAPAVAAPATPAPGTQEPLPKPADETPG